MGKIVGIANARAKRAREQQRKEQEKVHGEIARAIARGEGCPWSEEDLVEGWSKYVRTSWRPREGIKRGCIKRAMRKAYALSDAGTDWLKPSPYDLICVALPDPFGDHNVEAATYLTMLLYDYLYRIAAISEDEMNFMFGAIRQSEGFIGDMTREYGCIPTVEEMAAIRAEQRGS